MISPGPAGRQVDLLVVSLGGDPTVAWRIMTLLRDRVKKVGVLVPQAALRCRSLVFLLQRLSLLLSAQG
jgi:hypothetical protein